MPLFGIGGFRRDPERERLLAEQKAKDDAERLREWEAKAAQADEARKAREAERRAEQAAREIREAEIRERSRWAYTELADEMRETSKSLAKLVSNEAVDLPFPYSGGSLGIINIRKSGLTREAIFQVTTGQFNRVAQGYSIATKADQRAIEHWMANPASNHDTSIMFITQVAAFVRSISDAKRLILEADFYNAGTRQFVFEPEGLDRRFLS